VSGWRTGASRFSRVEVLFASSYLRFFELTVATFTR
jgi:hypothetical protein